MPANHDRVVHSVSAFLYADTPLEVREGLLDSAVIKVGEDLALFIEDAEAAKALANAALEALNRLGVTVRLDSRVVADVKEVG